MEINQMNVKEVWKSGIVRRWHSNPDMACTNQNNGHHSWGCAVLALHLFPDDYELLKAAIIHDVAEVNIGDVSGLAKHLNADLKEAIDNAERLNQDILGVDYTSSDKLKIVDMLDAYLWVKHCNPEILKKDGWPEMVMRIYELSNELNICVADMI